MKCAELYPDGSYQECQRDLQHRGDHEYVGITWARPEPAEPDPDVERLLEESLPPRSYGINERSYPIVVEQTTVHVIWVEGDTEDEALAYWADDDGDLNLDGTNVIDASREFRRPDEFERQDAMRSNRLESGIGPLVQCPDCGNQAFRRVWYHDPYRKCHGPIAWRTPGFGRPMREFQATPVRDAARQAVSS